MHHRLLAHLRSPAWAVLLTLLVSLMFRTPTVDDAFITYRYSANAALGHGLVYNVTGSPVLGTTSPLWAVILIPFSLLSIPLAWAAVGLSFVSLATAGLYFAKTSFRSAPQWAAAIPLLLLSFYPHTTLWSGLETCTYCACLIGVFLSLERRSWTLAILLSAAATLLRPDGLITFGIILISQFWETLKTREKSEPRTFFGIFYSCLLFLALLAPWLWYALRTYGSVLPFSIAAKQVVHPGSPLENLLFLSEALLISPYDFLLFIFGVAGMAYLVRSEKLWQPFAWLALYILGLTFSGVQPIFYWYLTPVWVLCLTYGIRGIACWARENRHVLELRQFPSRLKGVSGSMFLLFVSASCMWSMFRAKAPDVSQERDLTYLQIGSAFASQIKQGETLYACETGTMGYEFLQANMIDSSGINSPGVYEIRKKVRDGFKDDPMRRARPDQFSRWSFEVVEQFSPEWIVGPRGWCQLALMEDDAEFQKKYSRISLYRPDLVGGIAVYRRR